MLTYANSIWTEAMKSLRRTLIRTVPTIVGLVVGIAAFILRRRSRQSRFSEG